MVDKEPVIQDIGQGAEWHLVALAAGLVKEGNREGLNNMICKAWRKYNMERVRGTGGVRTAVSNEVERAVRKALKDAEANRAIAQQFEVSESYVCKMLADFTPQERLARERSIKRQAKKRLKHMQYLLKHQVYVEDVAVLAGKSPRWTRRIMAEYQAMLNE